MGARWMRNTFIYLLIVVAVVAIVWSLLAPRSSSPENKTLGEVIALARDGKVDSIEVNGDSLKVSLKGDSQEYKSRKESDYSIDETLKNAGITVGGENGVDIKVKEPSKWGNWAPILFNILPIVIIGAVLIFMLRQGQGSNSQAMSFGESRARLFSGSQ